MRCCELQAWKERLFGKMRSSSDTSMHPGLLSDKTTVVLSFGHLQHCRRGTVLKVSGLPSRPSSDSASGRTSPVQHGHGISGASTLEGLGRQEGRGSCSGLRVSCFVPE